MATDKEDLAQLKAELAQLKRQLAAKNEEVDHLRHIAPDIIRAQGVAQTREERARVRAELQATTHVSGGRAKYYIGDQPAYVRGTYHPPFSVISVPADHVPSVTWEPVDKHGRRLTGEDAPEPEGEPELDEEDLEELGEDDTAPESPKAKGKKAKRAADQDAA